MQARCPNQNTPRPSHEMKRIIPEGHLIDHRDLTIQTIFFKGLSSAYKKATVTDTELGIPVFKQEKTIQTISPVPCLNLIGVNANYRTHSNPVKVPKEGKQLTRIYCIYILIKKKYLNLLG